MNVAESNTLVMQSNPEGITMVDPFLRSISTIAHLSFDKYHNLLVAVTEAVNNAIIHAHHFDSEKLISIEVLSSENQISICVSDCGAGFNVNDVPDPRLPENVLREGGRGVFLIRSLSDVSDFKRTADGMVVTMNFLVN
ncbi:MAG: ATP-binding protein [Ignavibacteria bacterium]|nr:ATP-binding protein [Ignavibacteria bacterium]